MIDTAANRISTGSKQHSIQACTRPDGLAVDPCGTDEDTSDHLCAPHPPLSHEHCIIFFPACQRVHGYYMLAPRRHAIAVVSDFTEDDCLTC